MHERAGQLATQADLIDVDRVIGDYYDLHPNADDPTQQVTFGTSGHRGSSSDTSFNDDHVAAISQAIAEQRAAAGITGPLLLGADTHALSGPALRTALSVLVANNVTVLIDSNNDFVPTPALSHAILRLNGRSGHHAAVPGGCDGIIVTPSHNPPRDGGFKYNPPHGGPADTDITDAIAQRANQLLRDGLHGVRRVTENEAFAAAEGYDFAEHYIAELGEVLDMAAIAKAGVRIGADPLGGAAVNYWPKIAERYGLTLQVVRDGVDPTWSTMTLDHDGKIRMDCSSPWAMASLVAMRDHFDVATGNDADADRHGIVTPDGGLLNPNHYLCAAIDYLIATRDQWPNTANIGKTLVSSSLIDEVAAAHERHVMEVPVGFKWFVDGLLAGTTAFGGEESAGASFLRRDGNVWTTDKDGIILALLAAEMIATTGQTPSQRYTELTQRFGTAHYARIDAPATAEQKKRLKGLQPQDVTQTELAGEPITAILTKAPGNDAPIGGLKVTTKHAWFAARPSGTENLYKIYAESLVSAEHLAAVQREAVELVNHVLGQ